MATHRSVTFLKGHGTGNDFIVIPDLADELALSDSAIAEMCDRHTGLGADGVLRVVQEALGGFFMDYRNADGSIAEICGNGLRVFARYLVEASLEQRGVFEVGTRAGRLRVRVRPDDDQFDDVAVALGKAEGSFEPSVFVTVDDVTLPGAQVHMPNPHCVSVVSSIAEAGDLQHKPTVDPVSAYPHGANFEFIERRGDRHIGMRTYERGVGETLSCGSGACAAAYVWAGRENLTMPWSVRVDVLGGTVHVDCDETGVLTLRGPARIIARGEVVVSS